MGKITFSLNGVQTSIEKLSSIQSLIKLKNLNPNLIIIEYNGTDWVISFDSSNTDVVQYVTNQTSMSQYKWTGTTWIDSFQGQYKPGFWKLELDAS